MDGKTLKKLNRKDLLEILLEQTKRIEELESEVEGLRKEISERKASIKDVGSLAEASLVLSDIFKSADETANIYMNNIKELAIQEEKKLKKELRELKKKKLLEIDKECEKRLSKTEKEIEKISKSNNHNNEIKKEKTKTKSSFKKSKKKR